MLNKIIFFLHASCLIAVLIYQTGCQNSIVAGNELLDDEKLNLTFVDTLPLSSVTIRGERIITRRPGSDTRVYFAGQIADDIFGKVTAELLFTSEYPTSTPPNYQANTGTIKFDSLVLQLQYDTLGTYGRENNTYRIELFQLESPMAKATTYYSDTTLSYNPVPLFQNELTVRPKDSITVINHKTGKLMKMAPHLRIKLNDDFGKSLLNNNEAALSDSTYFEFIKGFCLKATPLGIPSLFGLNLSGAARASTVVSDKLVMYYTVNDTLKKEYNYQISGNTANRFVHDISGSAAANFILNPMKGDSLTFLQGMGGVKTVVSFDNLSFLKDKLLNKAVLELFVDATKVPEGVYFAPPQLLASRMNDSGKLELISDVTSSLSSSGTVYGTFNGSLNKTGTIQKYNLNITNFIKSVLKGTIINSDLYIGLLNESETPSRAVLFGAKHSKYPMKLKVTYTNK